MKIIVLTFCLAFGLLGCNSKTSSAGDKPKRYLNFSSQFPEKYFHWYIEVNYKATRDIFFCKTINEASFDPYPRNKTVGFSVDSSGGPIQIPLFEDGLFSCDWKLTFVNVFRATNAGTHSMLWLTEDTTDLPLKDTIKFNCNPISWNQVSVCNTIPSGHDFFLRDSTSSVNLYLSVNLKEKHNE